jgi:hypothetical protein
MRRARARAPAPAHAHRSLCVWYKVRCDEIRYDPIDGPLFLPSCTVLDKISRRSEFTLDVSRVKQRFISGRSISGGKLDVLDQSAAFNNA